jgi:hypothetical protein
MREAVYEKDRLAGIPPGFPALLVGEFDVTDKRNHRSPRLTAAIFQFS